MVSRETLVFRAYKEKKAQRVFRDVMGPWDTLDQEVKRAQQAQRVIQAHRAKMEHRAQQGHRAQQEHMVSKARMERLDKEASRVKLVLRENKVPLAWKVLRATPVILELMAKQVPKV
jgi:hypothetical protein